MKKTASKKVAMLRAKIPDFASVIRRIVLTAIVDNRTI